MKIPLTLGYLALLTIIPTAWSANIIVSTPTTNRITLGNGDTGTVNTAGSIIVDSNSNPVVTMTGTSSLTNDGRIEQQGTSRAIDSNSGGSNLTVTNRGQIIAVSGDAFRVNNGSSSVLLTNYGTIQVTNGGQAIDWAGISTGSNTLNNEAGATISSYGEDAVRPGQNGVVNNAGTISATLLNIADPGGSDGIDLRTQKNVTVTNTGIISGRSGIATDGENVGPSTLTLYNNAGEIVGLNGSGINVDGVSTSVQVNITNAYGATIRGSVASFTAAGDGDGIDVDGMLTLVNSGDVLGYGAKGNGSDTLPNGAQAISIGGGSITNTSTGRIIGSSLASDAPNGDTSRIGEGILVDNSSQGNAIAATTVDNSGLIQGRSGASIRMIGTFANTITNRAGGTLRGAGTGAAIQSGNGNDTIHNAGTITGDNGLAIDMQGGNNTLNVTGGAAQITGNINGGTGGTNQMNIEAGSGNAFSYAHTISNFNQVDIVSGTTQLTSTSAVNSSTAVKNGARLESSGTFGGAGTSLLVENGGALSVTATGVSGSLLFNGTGQTLSLQSGSSLYFDIGGTTRGSGYDYIGGPGLSNLLLSTTGSGVSIGFNFLSGYTAAAGDSFDLFDATNGATLNGLYTLSAAPTGFTWDTTNFLSQGIVSLQVAVPEPSRAVLLLVALAALTFRRNRRS